jgi:hypothetical protein
LQRVVGLGLNQTNMYMIDMQPHMLWKAIACATLYVDEF